MNMKELLPVITRESVEMISTSAPQAYEQGKASHDACIAYGEKILARLESEGMSDELDRDMAKYVDRSRQTVKKINELRSPITKLFDEFRNVFTTLENEVNPTTKTSVPGKVQLARNQYAAFKRAEEEKRRAEELEKMRKEDERKAFMFELEEERKTVLNQTIRCAISQLEDWYKMVTPDNYKDIEEKIGNFSCEYPNKQFYSTVQAPVRYFTVDEIGMMRIEVANRVRSQIAEQYRFEMESTRDDLLSKIPGKVKELQEIARASAEEAERRRQQMAAVEAEEAARKEEERKRKEEEERAKQEAARMSAEVETLFGQAKASVPDYAPKTKVKLKMNILNPEGFPEALMFWWSREGKTLSVDELTKKFKTIITYCEKVANSEGTKIQSEHIEYVEEVKAM